MPDARAGEGDRQVSALRHYLTIALRRRWLVLACLVMPLGAAVGYSLTQPKLYRGGAQVVLSRQNLANALTNTPDPTSQANDFLRIVQTQADIARSPIVAQRVLRAVRRSGWTFQQFLEHSSVEPKRDADLLVFRVWNTS